MPERGSQDSGGGAAHPPTPGDRHDWEITPEARLAAIVDSAEDAILSKSRTGDITSWNAAAERLYGYTREEAIGKKISIIIPPDRAGEEWDILDRILAGGQVDHYETERVRKDGTRVTVSLTVSPVRGPQGEVVGASVVARDVTEQRRAQDRAARLQAITAALTEALSPQEIVDLAVRDVLPALGADAAVVALLSEDGRTLRLTGSEGYSREGLEGWEQFPVDADLPLSEAVRTLEPVWTDSEEALVARYPPLATADIAFASLAAVPLVVEQRAIGGMALSFRGSHPFDAEERAFILAVANQAAGALERGRLYEREQRARAEAERARERLAFLSRASEILSESLELDTTLQRIADVAVPRIAEWCTVDLATDGDIRRVALAHQDPARVAFAHEVQRRYPTEPDAPTGVPAVIRTGVSELYPEVTDEMLVAGAKDEAHLSLLRMLDLRSVMIVPLSARGRTLGAVTFITSGSGHRYGEDDLAFAEDLARRAALAVDNSLLYREEHHAAITLQRSLLPDGLPEMPGLELAARYLPAGRGIEVGGDWYDALRVGDRIVVAVGDVAGRGIGSASVMGQLRNALRAYAVEGHPPAQALQRLNGLATGSDGADMATLIYVVVDTRNGHLEYVRAGHPPALVRRPDGTVQRLGDAGSPPLGIFEGAVYRSGDCTLAPGSLVLLYTDGLVERRDRPIEEQLQRLEDALQGSPEELEAGCDFLLRSMGVDEHAGDDTALLAFRLDPTGNGGHRENGEARNALAGPWDRERPGRGAADRRASEPRGHLRLRVAAELDALAPIRRELEEWLRSTGLHLRTRHAMVTACNEACTNAVEHAYPGAESGAVEVEGSLVGNRVTVSVRDFGRWRDPARVRHGTEAERGRGLEVIEGLIDEVRVASSAGGTEVVMTHTLEESAAA